MSAISPSARANFETILRACQEGRLVLLDCQDKATGKPVVVLAAVGDAPGGEYDLVPFAKLFEGNPYDELNPPAPKGGYRS